MTAAAQSTATAFHIDVEDGVAIITFDLPGESVNKFTAAVIEEFASVLDRMQRDANILAGVFLSGKPDVFVAGADIEMFLKFNSAADGEALSAAGQMLLDRIAKLRTPMVAAIHGACVGGGTETVLACAYRICTDHPKTVLSLPEVMLGLIPGTGGTQRLPRLVGLQSALDMILTGRNIRAKKALQIGLVDEMVPLPILREIAVDRARKLASGAMRRSRGRKHVGVVDWLLEKNPIGRAVVFRKAHADVIAKTHGNFPAPLAALRAVKTGFTAGALRGYQEEARLFGEMSATPQCKQLVFLFFATTAL